MNWESFMVDLTLTLLPVLSTLAAYVLIAIGRFVLSHTNNTIVKTALANLEKIILATVSALSQTLVDDLKRSKPDGKLSDEEAELIKNKALSSIRKQISVKQLEVLEKNFGSVEELIDNLLEEKVMETKLKKGHF
ncbi:MAG: hypothetical protein PWQ67_73 [Clostridia bacterium]|jgi:hypothetical protein|nr:hypothetical protein [Clostridia bacterium]MDN5321619.1 hypothetical protein [Clostridia bacterium]